MLHIIVYLTTGTVKSFFQESESENPDSKKSESKKSCLKKSGSKKIYLKKILSQKVDFWRFWGNLIFWDPIFFQKKIEKYYREGFFFKGYSSIHSLNALSKYFHRA